MLSPHHQFPTKITRATRFFRVPLLGGTCFFIAYILCSDYMEPTKHSALDDPHFLQADHQHRRLNPSIGSFNLLVLLVYFPEHVSRPRPSREYFEHLCETEIMDYLQKQSYGLYNLMSCRVQPWIATNYSQELYAGSDSNLVGSEYASSFFVPVLTALDDYGNGLDWQADFDHNQDGRLDALLVLHSGYDAAYRRGGECGDPNYRDRIQSQGHANSSGNAWISYDGSVSLQGYAIASAYDWVCDPNRATTMGVPVHELLHTLGSAPDLYDGSTGKLGGIASFDVMASTLGPARTGRPASASSYIKQRLGWLNYTEIEHDGEYRLATVNRYAEHSTFVIKKGFAVDEYLLLEFRQAIDYDTDLFGGGLLIIHVDDSKRLQGVGGYPGLEGWPENGLHYRVALLQADGQYDLERGVNNGDAGDIWKPGMTLGPGSTSSIDNESGSGVVYPNTDSYQNGNIIPTGISIAVLKENGEHVTIQVSGFAADTESGSTAVTLMPTVSPTIAMNVAQNATFAPITAMIPSPGPADGRVSGLPTTLTDAVTSLPPPSDRPTLSSTLSPPYFLVGMSRSPLATQQTTMKPSVEPSNLRLLPSSGQPSLSLAPSVSTDPTLSKESTVSLQPNDSAIVSPTNQLPTTSAPSPKTGMSMSVSAFPNNTRNGGVDENTSSLSSNMPIRCYWTATWITVGLTILIVQYSM